MGSPWRSTYEYGESSPIDRTDPLGLYSLAGGREAHTKIMSQYREDHAAHADQIRFDLPIPFVDHPFKGRPDIYDLERDIVIEIKPATVYGIATGPTQLQRYMDNCDCSADPYWSPKRSFTVQGRPTGAVNLGGVVYYSDLSGVAVELTAATMLLHLKDLMLARRLIRMGSMASRAYNAMQVRTSFLLSTI